MKSTGKTSNNFVFYGTTNECGLSSYASLEILLNYVGRVLYLCVNRKLTKIYCFTKLIKTLRSSYQFPRRRCWRITGRSQRKQKIIVIILILIVLLCKIRCHEMTVTIFHRSTKRIGHFSR